MDNVRTIIPTSSFGLTGKDGYTFNSNTTYSTSKVEGIFKKQNNLGGFSITRNGDFLPYTLLTVTMEYTKITD